MSDSVRASHILLMYAGSARSTATRSKDQALAEIQKLKTDIDAANLTLGDDVLDDIQSIFKRFPRTL